MAEKPKETPDTLSLEAKGFQERASLDPTLWPFLGQVAADAADEAGLDPPQRMMDPLTAAATALVSIAAYALFRFVKDIFDADRAKQETKTLRERARVVEELVARGIPPQLARATVDSLLRQMAKRSADDAVLKKALALLGSGK